MAPIYHELDPDGDLVLVLSTDSYATEGVTYDILRELGIEEPAFKEAGATEYHERFPEAIGQEEDDPLVPSDEVHPPIEGEEEPVIEGHEAAGAAINPDVLDAAADREIVYRKVHIRVSSKHLTFASPIFKNMLDIRFEEGAMLRAQGHLELPLPEDDPASLLILLKLIHGRYKLTPRKISLEMLNEVAILVDKYQLLHSAEIFLPHWLEDLGSNIPSTLNKDLLKWMSISSAFKKHDILERVIQVALLESEGPLEVDDLPIPERVLSKIDQDRQRTIAEVLAFLQDAIHKYESEQVCPRGIECNSMTLGSLRIGMKAAGIIQPPLPPYNGLSINGLFMKLHAMPLPHYCKIRDGFGYVPDCEGLKVTLEAKLKSLGQQYPNLAGLDLEDHAASSELSVKKGKKGKKGKTNFG